MCLRFQCMHKQAYLLLEKLANRYYYYYKLEKNTA